MLYLWHERRGTRRFNERSLEMLEMLAPAFTAACELTLRYAKDLTNLSSTVDSISDPCALYTIDARLLHRNRVLTTLLAEDRSIGQVVAALCDDAARQLGTPTNVGRELAWEKLGTLTRRAPVTTYRARACYLSIGARASQPAIFVVAAPVAKIANAELTGRYRLTAREVDVAHQLAARRTNKEIAAVLGLSLHTVRHHVESVMRKLGVASRLAVATLLRDRAQH